MCENSAPGTNGPLSNTPSGPPSASTPLVTVCAATSTLDHVTSPPMPMVTVCGTKHSLSSSHPGTEDPSAIVTSACPLTKSPPESDIVSVVSSAVSLKSRVPINVVAVMSRSSLKVYGPGSVRSSYSAVTVSPSVILRRWPEDSTSVLKATVPSNMPVASSVSVTVRSMPPASVSDQTLMSKLSTASGLIFMSGSITCTTPVPDAG